MYHLAVSAMREQVTAAAEKQQDAASTVKGEVGKYVVSEVSHSKYHSFLMDLLAENGARFREYAKSVDGEQEPIAFVALVAAIDDVLQQLTEDMKVESVARVSFGSQTKNSLLDSDDEMEYTLGDESSMSQLGMREEQAKLEPSFGSLSKGSLLDDDEPEDKPGTLAQDLSMSMIQEFADESKPVLAGESMPDPAGVTFQLDRAESTSSATPSEMPGNPAPSKNRRDLRRLLSTRRRMSGRRLGNAISSAQSFRHPTAVTLPSLGRQISAPQERRIKMPQSQSEDVAPMPALTETIGRDSDDSGDSTGGGEMLQEDKDPETQIPTPLEKGDHDSTPLASIPSASVTFAEDTADLNSKSVSSGARALLKRRASQGSQSSMQPPLRVARSYGEDENVLPEEEEGEDANNEETPEDDAEETIPSKPSVLKPSLLTRYQSAGSKRQILPSRPGIAECSDDFFLNATPGLLRYQSSTDYSSKNDYSSVDSDNRFWEAEIAELEAMLDDCEVEIDMLDGQLRKYRHKNRELSDAFQKKRRALIKLEERYAYLKVEIARARSVEDDLEIQLSQMVMERDLQVINLTNDINQLSVDHTRLKQTHRFVCKDLMKVESELARAEAKHARTSPPKTDARLPEDVYIIRSIL